MVNRRERSRHCMITMRSLSSNSTLAHEHDFVSARFRNASHCIIYCLTCYASFCSSCGKILNNSTINSTCLSGAYGCNTPS